MLLSRVPPCVENHQRMHDSVCSVCVWFPPLRCSLPDLSALECSPVSCCKITVALMKLKECLCQVNSDKVQRSCLSALTFIGKMRCLVSKHSHERRTVNSARPLRPVNVLTDSLKICKNKKWLQIRLVYLYKQTNLLLSWGKGSCPSLLKSLPAVSSCH